MTKSFILFMATTLFFYCRLNAYVLVCMCAADFMLLSTYLPMPKTNRSKSNLLQTCAVNIYTTICSLIHRHIPTSVICFNGSMREIVYTFSFVHKLHLYLYTFMLHICMCLDVLHLLINITRLQ